jgi:hypothetical protein
VLAPAFALGAVAGAVGIVGGPIKSTQRPDSLVWAERVFPTRPSFETWLRARGASYTKWALRHPSAAAVFESGSKRALAEGPPAQPVTKSTRRPWSHSWIAALIAGISIALLVALYALRSRLMRAAAAARSPWHRPAKPVAIPRPRMPALAKADWPLLATSATAALRRPALRRPSSLVAAAHAGLTAHRVRHVLPTVAFYAISVALAIVIGASVAIYLQ